MLILILLLLGTPKAQAVEDLASRLKAQNFVCASSALVPGAMQCQFKVDGYTQPVHIYLPLALKPNPALLYYLHGFWLDEGTNPFAGEHGNFDAALSEAARNAVIIVPESRGYNRDYRQQFRSAYQLNQFITNVETRLVKAGIMTAAQTPRLLAGHSAAYVTLAQIGDWIATNQLPALKNLSGVALLDTAYGYRPGLIRLLDVICKNPGRAAVYYQVFNPADGARDKFETNLKLNVEATHEHACARANLVFLAEPNVKHMDFPRLFLGQFLNLSLDGDDHMATQIRVPLGRAPAGALHDHTM